eukprot:scaffold205052_cov16-Tisochrysis_lutea.AAC.2
MDLANLKHDGAYTRTRDGVGVEHAQTSKDLPARVTPELCTMFSCTRVNLNPLTSHERHDTVVISTTGILSHCRVTLDPLPLPCETVPPPSLHPSIDPPPCEA